MALATDKAVAREVLEELQEQFDADSDEYADVSQTLYYIDLYL